MRIRAWQIGQAAHLRELARNLTHAEQRERDHLYELLHDEMQPLLVAARLSLSGLGMHLPPDDWLKVAAEANQHISRAIAVARTLSLRLSPPLIRERGLNPALESLCRWVRDNHGLEVELSSAPEAESDDMALRLLCFNAVRELLMNVVKHAGAARVKLTLELVDGDTLRITVADRGSGFDPSTITGGSGLSAIERRLGMQDSAPEEILEAIRRAGRGERYLSPQLAEKLLAGTAGNGRKQPHDNLSEREFAVMRLLSQGMALTAIAESMHLSPKTVSTYRARVMEKLGLRNNAELTRYVIERKLGQ